VPTFTQAVFAQTFRGHVEKTESMDPNENTELFTGETEILDEKETVKMTVSQVLSSGYTREGDEFFAELTDDVEGAKGVIIPKGSVAHGVVTIITDPKRGGRNGYIVVNFDYIVTSDGREIPIEGTMTTKENKAVGAIKNVAQHTGYTLAGGLVGGLMALNVFGIEAAIASQGYLLAGGAAVGGIIALSSTLYRKGKEVLIKPGDELKVKLLSEVELPVFTEEALREDEFHYDGLKVQINEVIHEKDPFGELNTITMTLNINNLTKKTFSTFDIALVNDYKAIFYASPFGETDLWFQKIEPGDRVQGKLSFCVNDVKRKHWLVFYDRINKEELARISIDNVRQDLEEAQKSRKSKRSARK